MRNTVLLGLAGLFILTLSACGGGVSVGDVGVNDATQNSAAEQLTEQGVNDAERSEAEIAAAGGGSAGQSLSADPALSDDPTTGATLASLVGFFVTGAKGDIKNYAEITSDGSLTDYTYDQSGDCYHPTSTQITDQGSGVFWVTDGDGTRELRFGRQDGNLVLFRNDINEDGRFVYPAISSVAATDLPMCS